MPCIVILNEWWYDCGEFQALQILCSHPIAACASCNLNCDDFVDPIYKLKNIYKVYRHRFHFLGSEDKLPQYLGPYFIPDPSKRRDTMERPVTSRMNNETDEQILNRPKKYSLCITQGHNCNNYPYKQVGD